MTASLKLVASHSDIEEYQRLLKSDFSKETLHSVLSLLWKLISESANPRTFALQKGLVYPPRAGKAELDRYVVDRIRQFAGFLNRPPLPPVPSDFSKMRLDHSGLEAQQVWTYLCLQTLIKLSTKRRPPVLHFFNDLQSLLFLCSIEQVLPALRKQGQNAAHDFLVNAHFCHTVIAWHHDPSHQFYLRSVLMDYLQQPELSYQLRAMSLRLTDVDDHSYLTKVQAVWSDLMDLGRVKEAHAFLFKEARSTPEDYQAELQEMATLTAEALNGKRKH